MRYFQNSFTIEEKNELKREIFDSFYFHLNSIHHAIAASKNSDRKNKSKRINEAINGILLPVQDHFLSFQKLDQDDKAIMALIVQYCYTCISIEERQKVWRYDFMSFSRRIGELWERFCSVAWDFSTITQRFKAPCFSTIREKIINDTKFIADDSSKKLEIIELVESLLDIIGDISLKEDEMFFHQNKRFVIDFKSGFGSNEKGNMLRLQAVANAYKKYDSDTILLLLVRQNKNNNYLEVLKNSKLWEVYTSDDAYNKIYQLTNVDIRLVIKEFVDFNNDLSPAFIDQLRNSDGDLLSYLSWR